MTATIILLADFQPVTGVAISPFILRHPNASLLNARASSHNKQPNRASGNARYTEE